jgi:hypothetical protein
MKDANAQPNNSAGKLLTAREIKEAVLRAKQRKAEPVEPWEFAGVTGYLYKAKAKQMARYRRLMNDDDPDRADLGPALLIAICFRDYNGTPVWDRRARRRYCRAVFPAVFIHQRVRSRRDRGHSKKLTEDHWRRWSLRFAREYGCTVPELYERFDERELREQYIVEQYWPNGHTADNLRALLSGYVAAQGMQYDEGRAEQIKRMWQMLTGKYEPSEKDKPNRPGKDEINLVFGVD